ncbi:MAG: hypothetical protein ACPGVK_06135 [Halocynthiibacter sp.]
MAQYFFTDVQITSGRWRAVMHASAPVETPDLLVTHLEQPLEDITVENHSLEKNAWRVSAGIPVEAISDGVQVFRVYVNDMDTVVETFTILAGKPLEEDIRAEVQLLREELDMLKKAFRRHALASMD